MILSYHHAPTEGDAHFRIALGSPDKGEICQTHADGRNSASELFLCLISTLVSLPFFISGK